MYFCTYMGVYITDSMNMNLSKLWEAVRTGKPGMLQSMGFLRIDLTD